MNACEVFVVIVHYLIVLLRSVSLTASNTSRMQMWSADVLMLMHFLFMLHWGGLHKDTCSHTAVGTGW